MYFQCFYQLQVIFTLSMNTSVKTVSPCGHSDDLANAEQTGAQGIPERETLDASEYCSDSHFMYAEQEQTQS